MNPNREEAQFALALTKPAEKRAAWLDAECDGDAALRQRLDALLAAHEQPETLLATQADRRDELHESPSRSQGLTDLDPPREAPDEAVGQTLGRYKLLERVGEGGCGVVYVAEQSQPVRRRVALKVIKLGMDTKQEVGPEANRWFTRSAEQGYADARYQLGLLLYEGKLVTRDRVAGAQWACLAANQKHREARHLLDELELFLSAAEMAEARKRADAFKPAEPTTAPQP